jgi:hypothetical protein
MQFILLYIIILRIHPLKKKKRKKKQVKVKKKQVKVIVEIGIAEK